VDQNYLVEKDKYIIYEVWLWTQISKTTLIRRYC